MAHTERLAGLGETQSALLRLLLHNKAGLSVDEIGARLGITRTAVNQHLGALESAGFAQRADFAQTGGRPSRLYSLTEAGLHLFPKQYGLFAAKALEALISTVGEDASVAMLEQIGDSLGRETGEKIGALPLDQRVAAIADALKTLGYDAAVDSSPEPDTALISAQNCVFHSLAQANTNICKLDLAFLRACSGARVEHVECMAKGENACRFRFSQRADKAS